MNEEDYPDWLGEPVSKEEAEQMMREYLSYMMGIDPE